MCKKTRKVYIGFSRPRTWKPLSAAIMGWWGTDYSHVYIRWETPWGFDEVLEASGLSVHMTEATRWEKNNKIIKEYKFEVPKETFHALMTAIRPLTGLPYGWSQALGIALSEAFNLDKNPIASGSSTFVCSEVGLRAMKILGFATDKNEDLVSPKDLRDLLEEEH